MNRRGFLKGLGLGLGLAMVAAPMAVKAAAEMPKPEPEKLTVMEKWSPGEHTYTVEDVRASDAYLEWSGKGLKRVTEIIDEPATMPRAEIWEMGKAQAYRFGYRALPNSSYNGGYTVVDWHVAPMFKINDITAFTRRPKL